nr:MAG TPA: hypothetical protein [Caudoviricetes sp.]
MLSKETEDKRTSNSRKSPIFQAFFTLLLLYF